ncbi:MAG: hypothetical protein AABY96_00430 [Nitrospirota bacterium]
MTIHETARAALAAMFGIWLLQMMGCATPKEIAQNSLVDLHKLTVSAERADDEAFAKDIGFKSLEEMAEAQLASPLRLYTVPLVKLAKFQPSDDPNKLLEDTHSLIFPLTINNQFRSSLIVRESLAPNITDLESFAKAYKAYKAMRARHTGTGFPRLMPELEKLKPTSSSFLVSIAPLRLFFLGDRKAEGLVLTAIQANPHFELNARLEYDAAELFSKIAWYAQRVYESDQKIRQKSPGDAPLERPYTERAPYAR